MIWFWADPHLNHSNIIGYCSRPFGDSSEMTQKLIENFNSRVQKKETVYILGDIGFGLPDKIRTLLDKLHGELYLIRGNHDENIINKPQVSARFKWIKDLHVLRYQRQKIVLCHYPLESWQFQAQGAFHLHGHCHGNLKRKVSRRMDIGVDCTNYFPISFDEINNILSKEGVYHGGSHESQEAEEEEREVGVSEQIINYEKTNG